MLTFADILFRGRVFNITLNSLCFRAKESKINSENKARQLENLSPYNKAYRIKSLIVSLKMSGRVGLFWF
jgi:hypothetical protein